MRYVLLFLIVGVVLLTVITNLPDAIRAVPAPIVKGPQYNEITPGYRKRVAAIQHQVERSHIYSLDDLYEADLPVPSAVLIKTRIAQFGWELGNPTIALSDAPYQAKSWAQCFDSPAEWADISNNFVTGDIIIVMAMYMGSDRNPNGMHTVILKHCIRRQP